MNHIGTQYIETDRLILRKLERSDAQSFVDNIASDREVTKFLAGWPENCTVPMMEGILDNWIGQYPEMDCYNWAIVLKEEGPEAIGQILVFDWNEAAGAPNLSCCIGRRWWNQGIMTEALGAVIDFLMKRVGVRRIEAYHDQDNPASGRVMKKCGMNYEGKRDWACCYFIDAEDSPMKHIGTQSIETDRLILRRFELSDAPAMFANWASDDEVTKYLTWPTHADVSVTEGILEKWVAQYGQNDCYRWAITLKENGPQPIGSIDACRWHEDGAVPEIGYCMGKRWWRRGIMSEALGTVIEFLLQRVGVERIMALHDVNNLHSGGVMRRCGMRFQEIREKSGRNNQGVCDMACYIIERGDR